jgi:hypothetical protein
MLFESSVFLSPLHRSDHRGRVITCVQTLMATVQIIAFAVRTNYINQTNRAAAVALRPAMRFVKNKEKYHEKVNYKSHERCSGCSENC